MAEVRARARAQGKAGLSSCRVMLYVTEMVPIGGSRLEGRRKEKEEGSGLDWTILSIPTQSKPR